MQILLFFVALPFLLFMLFGGIILLKHIYDARKYRKESSSFYIYIAIIIFILILYFFN